MFEGPVEADETYIGGRWRGKGRGPKGKAPVFGMRDRATGRFIAIPLPDVKRSTLHGLICQCVLPEAKVYTDGLKAYREMPHHHEWVDHTSGEYVRGEVTTNGIESLWAALKRGYRGVYHFFSTKHLHRYVNEFVWRMNTRRTDTWERIRDIIFNMHGRRLRYADLTR